MRRKLPTRQELERVRRRIFGPRKPKRNKAERDRKIERLAYSNPVTAEILRSLGKHGEARDKGFLGCASVECNREFRQLYAEE